MTAQVAPTFLARCAADERLITRALERIRERERRLIAQAAQLAAFLDRHAELSRSFEEHLKTCPLAACATCERMDREADDAFNDYCRLRGVIEAA